MKLIASTHTSAIPASEMKEGDIGVVVSDYFAGEVMFRNIAGWHSLTEPRFWPSKYIVETRNGKPYDTTSYVPNCKVQLLEFEQVIAQERTEVNQRPPQPTTESKPNNPPIYRYIVERYIAGEWQQAPELPFTVESFAKATELLEGARLRYPENSHRVYQIEFTAEEFAEQEHNDKLRRVADNILRQVVCDCGNYRHHGVGWMPEGSGEGLSTAIEILKKAGL